MKKNILIIKLLRVVGDLASVFQDLLGLYGKNIQHLNPTEFETACKELGGLESKLHLIHDKLDIIQIKLIEEKP